MTRGPRWHVIAEFIRKRDRNQCQRCKHSDSDEELSVHHFRPEDEIQDEWDPHLPTNLITLCRSCHSFVENLNFGKQLSVCHIENQSDLILGDKIRKRLNIRLRNRVSNAVARIKKRKSRQFIQGFEQSLFDFESYVI